MMDRRNLHDQHGASAFEDVDGSITDILPPDFVPGKWDVICQRGKECFDHVGNRRFRNAIDGHLDNYVKMKSRQQKSMIVTNIVESIKKSAGSANGGGGFVRKDLLTRRWFRVSDKLAREKVGQALRDAIKIQRTALAPIKKMPPTMTNSSKKAAASSSSNHVPNESPADKVGSSAGGLLPNSFTSLSQNSYLMRTFQESEVANIYSSDATQRSIGIMNPSRFMPLVPFVESTFGSLELEPRPIDHHAANMPLWNAHNVNTDSTSQQQHLEQQCESLIKAYNDASGRDATKDSLSNIVQSLDSTNNVPHRMGNPSRMEQSPLQIHSTQHSQGLTDFGGPFCGNYSFPTTEQHILPTIIETRRLSQELGHHSGDLGSTNPLDHANTGFFMPSNDFEQRRMEAECKAAGVEGGDFPHRASQRPGDA